MAVKIRLTRKGTHKRPFYRVVVMDSRMPRDGKSIEVLGTYNPLTEPARINIKTDQALQWLKKGAQASDTVKSLLKKVGVWQQFTEAKGKS